jgi:hypothetical protein
MRHFSTSSIAFLLVVLLASTTPVGTGGGAHQLDLLHPLFSHLHLVNGRLLTHEQVEQDASVERAPASGPTLGSGSGSSPDGGGAGVSPTLLLPILALATVAPARWPIAAVPRPRGREEAPPVPPPLP